VCRPDFPTGIRLDSDWLQTSRIPTYAASRSSS
jgi:hypothetical protein